MPLFIAQQALGAQPGAIDQDLTGKPANWPGAIVVASLPQKVVGGGARTNYAGNGSLLTRTSPGDPGQNAWAGAGKDHLVADPATVTTYAMTLADPADEWDVQIFASTSAVASHPVATATLPAGFALTGGGCTVNWQATPSAAGNLLTASFPSSLTTWECRGKDHSVASPASITAFVVGIRPRASDVPLPRVQITTAKSAVSAHPEAIAPAVAGWSVTGGGALALPADPAGAGQLLVGSYPERTASGQPATGWHAASKDHAVPSPGTVQAFAVNVDFGTSSRQGPLTVLAVGDSVMWGQGLADAHKFANQVAGILASNPFRSNGVNLVSMAHSGATLVPANPALEMTGTPGEVPNAYPSVNFQLATLGPRAVDPMAVDLVLMDGCINDIGVMTILKPGAPTDPPAMGEIALAQATRDKCGAPMLAALNSAHALYPHARIVVTGYFPIVSDASDLSFLPALGAGLGLAQPIFALAGLPIPAPDPVSGLVMGAAAGAVYKPIAVRHSSIFNDTSASTLAGVVQQFNAAAGPNTAVFVSPAFQPQNSYASPQTLLWLVPTKPPLWPSGIDEVYDARQSTCASVDFSKVDDGATARIECPVASMGHPNVDGANAYAQAIFSALTPFVPEWRAVHDVRAMNVTITPAAIDADSPQSVVVSATDANTGRPLVAAGDVYVGGTRVAALGGTFVLNIPSHTVAGNCTAKTLANCQPAHQAAAPVQIDIRGVPGHADASATLQVNAGSPIP